MATLLGSKTLETCVRATILTGRIKRTDVAPVSLLLVAPVERGKTQIALRNCGDKAVVLTDLTGIGILEALQFNPQATHIIINDLTTVTGHKSYVNNLTISVLNALAEEGCYNVAMPKLSHLRMGGRKVGVIACCTPGLVGDNRQWWRKSGFLSRLLVINYDHSTTLSVRIMEAIASNNGMPKADDVDVLKIPEAPIFVDISSTMASKLVSIAHVLRIPLDEIGYRKQKQLRSLACGHALLRGWKNPQVVQDDIDFIESMIPFIVPDDEKGVAKI